MKWWPLQTRKGLKVVVGLHPWQTSQPILTSSCITTNSLLVPYHIRSLDLQKHTVQFFLNFSILLHQHSQNKHPICTALSWYEAIRSIPQASFHATRLTSILCHWDVRYVIWTKSLGSDDIPWSIHCCLHLLLTNPLHFLISYLSPIYPIILYPHFLHS